MPRKSNEQPLKDVIQELLKAYGLDRKMKEVDIRLAWESLMGPVISKQTNSIKLREGVVTIVMNNSVLKEEFDYGKSKIQKMLNDELGADIVKEVRVY